MQKIGVVSWNSRLGTIETASIRSVLRIKTRKKEERDEMSSAEKTDRNTEIIDLYDNSNLTFAEIAEIYGITPSRAAFIYRKYRPIPVVAPPQVQEKDYDWDDIRRRIERGLFPNRERS